MIDCMGEVLNGDPAWSVYSPSGTPSSMGDNGKSGAWSKPSSMSIGTGVPILLSISDISIGERGF